MAANSQVFDLEHTLLAERDRLERILDVMYANSPLIKSAPSDSLVP